MDLENKVILVTGSSKGLGNKIAHKLAENKATVIINYNKSKKEALELQKDIKNEFNIEPMIIKCDVSKESEVIKMVEKIINKYGKIDVLINNAGISIDDALLTKDVNNFKKVLDVNLIGNFLTCKHVSKYMLKNKQGKIINIASTNGIDTFYPESADYDASKAGVISLTHNFAKELAPVITVNAVAPGWINTDMTKELDKKYRKEEENKILLQRFGKTDEIANLVLFLSSNLSSYINDTIIRIDGGKR